MISRLIPSNRRLLFRRTVLALAGFALSVAAFGCAAVPVYQQGYVSRTGMTFSDSMVESPRLQLLSQVEPGSAASGGAQAAGCTACR